jgi:hypothetical protein
MVRRAPPDVGIRERILNTLEVVVRRTVEAIRVSSLPQ